MWRRAKFERPAVAGFSTKPFYAHFEGYHNRNIMEMAKLEKKQKTIEVIFVFCKSQLMCKKLEGNRFTE